MISIAEKASHSMSLLRTLKALFTCINVFVGAEWAIRLIYLAGVIGFIGSALLIEDAATRENALMTSTILMTVPLTIYAPFRFRFFISNARFSLTPNNRALAFFALIFCAFMAVALSGLTAHVLGKNVAIRVALSALAFSAFSLLLQFAVTSTKKLALSFITVGFMAILAKRFMFPFPAVNDQTLTSVSLSVTALLWVSTFAWLHRARNIAPVSAMFTNPQNCAQDQAWLINLWSAEVQDMGPRALMHGMVDSLARRISLHAILLFGFPVGMVLMQVIFASDKSRFMENPISLLFLSSYALMMAPMINGDWLTRTRFLWLRQPGDRAGLFRFWANSIATDKAVTAVLLISYASLLCLYFDLPHWVLVSFVPAYIALDIFIALMWSLLRIRGWSLTNVTAVNFAASFLIAGTLFALGKFGIWLWFFVAVATLIVGAFWLTALLRKHFYQMDWSAVKPLRYGSKG